MYVNASQQKYICKKMFQINTFNIKIGVKTFYGRANRSYTHPQKNKIKIKIIHSSTHNY
jgi:hypothetical protein